MMLLVAHYLYYLYVVLDKLLYLCFKMQDRRHRGIIFRQVWRFCSRLVLLFIKQA